MNAVVTYRVADARAAVSTVDDVRQTLYREAQLALRAVVGARELDTFLTGKDGVASELAEMVRVRAKALGVELIAVGIELPLPLCARDIPMSRARLLPAGRDEGPDEQGHGGQEGHSTFGRRSDWPTSSLAARRPL
jgi:hypothetical protein